MIQRLLQRINGAGRGGAKADAAFIVDLTTVVDGVDAGLAKWVAAHVCAWPSHFDLDRVLVPAAKVLVKKRERSGVAFDALHAAAVAHLEARIAETLEPPRDWARPSAIGCQCQHCRELSRLLADAGSQTWTLRAAQNIRTHVENEISRARSDVNTRTERRGSPPQPDLDQEPSKLLAPRRTTQTRPRRPRGASEVDRELVAGLGRTRFEPTTKLLILLGQRLDRIVADGICN